MANECRITNVATGRATASEAARLVAYLNASKRGRLAARHEWASWVRGWGTGCAGLLLLLLLLGMSGCGYTQKELFPETYRTVAVPIFENRTFYRHVAMDLSEALIKEVEQRTPYKVVAPATADTILQGTVVQVEQTPLSRRPGSGVPEELEVRIVVNFEWKDLQAGQVLRSRAGFDAVGRYVVTRPVGEPFEHAQHTAVQRLATDIVSAMRAPE